LANKKLGSDLRTRMIAPTTPAPWLAVEDNDRTLETPFTPPLLQTATPVAQSGMVISYAQPQFLGVLNAVFGAFKIISNSFPTTKKIQMFCL